MAFTTCSPERSRQLLLVGLGNPGAAYQRTRHNLGFEVLDILAAELSIAFRRTERANIAMGSYGGRDLVLLKPLTFMNLSGDAVLPLARRKGLGPGAILAIHDDLDLALGKVRFKNGGGAGGHRGVASLVERLGTSDFARLKIGLGRPPMHVDPVEYVLQRPAPAERELLDEALRRAAEGSILWVREGLAAAMNAYNAPPLSRDAEEEQGAHQQGGDPDPTERR